MTLIFGRELADSGAADFVCLNTPEPDYCISLLPPKIKHIRLERHNLFACNGTQWLNPGGHDYFRHTIVFIFEFRHHEPWFPSQQEINVPAGLSGKFPIRGQLHETPSSNSASHPNVHQHETCSSSPKTYTIVYIDPV